MNFSSYIESLIQNQNESLDSNRALQINFLKEIEASLPILELVLPTQTFVKEHTIEESKRSVKLFSLGGGHSICDAMLYVPNENVLFAGDLLFVDTHPSLFEESNPVQWIDLLEKVAQLDVEFAIPGHGSVGTRQNLVQQTDYLKELICLAREPQPYETIPIPEIYKNWSSPEIFTQNLKLLKETLLVK